MNSTNPINTMNPTIVVFTPTYNEAENIEIFVEQVFKVLPECKLVVVDDNSPDGTYKKVEQLQKVYPNLYLVVRKERRGRGYAGIEGFKKCLQLGADIIVEMDADLSHSPQELPKLINSLKENPEVDIIVGSRYVSCGKDVERNIIRRFMSLFARTYLRIVTGLTLKDVTSGYKVYRRKVIETVLPYLTSSDPFIVTEVNYICKMHNFKFLEVPIEFHKRLYGRSKLSFGKLFKYIFKVWFLVIKWFLKDKYNVNFVKFLILMTMVRLLLINVFGLTDDESHYWQYSQHLDFSYYDHPPMVGYLIYLSTKIFGNSLYSVRIPAVLCFVVAVFYFYKLVKEMFNTEVAFKMSLLFNFIPVAFAGSVITLPDAPLGMFWMMYMFYFYKFVIQKDTWLLYLCGVILGCALLSKYNAVFLFISTLIIFIVYKDLRKYLTNRDFYVYCIIALSIFSPVILWNIAHKFVSFKYQFLHGFGTQKFVSLQTFFENFLFQSAYLSPVVFILLWWTIFLKFFIKEKKYKFLLYFALPGIIVFNLAAFKNRILPHWPAISYFVLLPFIPLIDKKKISYYLSLTTAVTLTCLVVLITLFGIIKIPKNLYNADTPDKLYGYDFAGYELYNLLKKYKNCFLFTHKYYVAGQIRFAVAKYFDKNIPEVFCIDDYVNQYDFWSRDLQNYTGKNAIYITEGRFPENQVLSELPFEQIKCVSIISFRKNKFWPTRVFKFYYCKNFDYNKLKQKFVQQQYNNYTSVLQFYREYDKTIFLKLNKSKLYDKKIFRILCYVLTNLGNGLVLIPLVILIFFLIDKKNFINNAVSFLVIIAIGGLIVQLLKNLFDKPRPLKLFFDILHQPINVIGEQLREFGFPSGHTFLAVSSAIFLSYKIKRPVISMLLFILAVLVGISRVLVGAHFLSDVIGGLILGVVYTSFCIKVEKELCGET